MPADPGTATPDPAPGEGANGRPESPERWAAHAVTTAFLHAGSDTEAYRRVLARVAPRVRANFSCIYLRDDTDPDILRLACIRQWPQSTARHLGRFRVRVGAGPSGLAVASGRTVEARDVFANPELEDWWEPARELGITALIAVPLRAGEHVTGALTCYYREEQAFGERQRELLEAIAWHLGGSAGLEDGDGAAGS